MKNKKRLGSSLIEMALVMPLFILILDGCIEFGIIFYNKAVITNASREGARYGIVLRDPSYATSAQIIAYTKTYCDDNLITFNPKPPSVSVTIKSSSSSPKFGDTLSVTVSYVYANLFLYQYLGPSKDMTLSATSVMAYE